MAHIEAFTDLAFDPPIRGFLHTSSKPSGEGLILAHGAGSNCQSPLLVAVAEVFSGTGFTVLLCDLPFRQKRPFGPPGPGDAKRDQAGLKHSVRKMRELVSGRVFLGGHSYGGRQATILCSAEAGLADGLLLLSYPLHPPGKPEQLRTQHFPRLQAPALFIQGTSDPFGSIEEMASAVKLIPGKTMLLPLENVGHDLGFKGKSRQEELPAAILAAFREFFGQRAQA